MVYLIGFIKKRDSQLLLFRNKYTMVSSPKKRGN